MPNPVGGDWEDDEGAEGREDEVAREVSPLRHGARHDRGGEGRE